MRWLWGAIAVLTLAVGALAYLVVTDDDPTPIATSSAVSQRDDLSGKIDSLALDVDDLAHRVRLLENTTGPTADLSGVSARLARVEQRLQQIDNDLDPSPLTENLRTCVRALIDAVRYGRAVPSLTCIGV